MTSPFLPWSSRPLHVLGAAQADDTEVDVSAWALPDKTDEQVRARMFFGALPSNGSPTI